ncbi:MAG: single-stranded DNA-binding protein [Alicyclobacillaceae bacterium]|jgi:single-strand DNA-binding protein|uniref:single-stranded DNA-binding protein n=1 Tax=Alicyclobacillus sp. SP_1 TaxID=2942475 RepID=UPI0021585E83|nr:single-stranded DNA-binding protein [Alicyclobacillus sp. SP_1]MCY0888790.1 single-stranded DNA-binding protein [Alicyclobacillaceae bacterium]MCY0895577.1 single-stranded DNA-binding protein [Alicyclobacillaceae bacterium]
MLNRVVLIGRLTQDPELRYTNSGTAVASFTLAVDRPRTNQAGERETDFINIVVWQKQAETVAQYLHKGRLAAVDGRLQIRSYENREGQKVRVAEVVAESVRFLDRGESSPRDGQMSAPPRPASASAPRRPETSKPAFEDDPFADDGNMMDISDDDLPF